MDESNTLRFLEGLQRFGWILGLDKISKILIEIGQPHNQFKSIHIAGTNGKGSTATMLESIYRQASYKTGLFTSPHLLSVCERIKVDAEPIPMDRLVAYIHKYRSIIERLGCTYFESLCAIAFRYFADTAVEIAIIEVGLGGRLDATNIISPNLSIITTIDFDHSEHLGSTLGEIATEKACILKNGVPALVQRQAAEAMSVIKKVATKKNVSLFSVDELASYFPQKMNEQYSEFSLETEAKTFSNLRIPLIGMHQIDNAVSAVLATQILQEMFKVENHDVEKGLLNVQWPGRLQLLQQKPKIVIDIAHNPEAISRVLDSLSLLFKYRKLILVIGLLRDKDIEAISKLVGSAADMTFVVTPVSDRALSSQVLGRELSKYTRGLDISSRIEDGFKKAISHASADDLICVTGSHYVVAEFMKFFKKA